MDFKKVLEELGVLKKFHTADKGREETIFYRGRDNPTGELIINDDVYDLERINLLSLSRRYGLLVHYNDNNDGSVCPYPYDELSSVRVKLG